MNYKLNKMKIRRAKTIRVLSGLNAFRGYYEPLRMGGSGAPVDLTGAMSQLYSRATANFEPVGSVADIVEGPAKPYDAPNTPAVVIRPRCTLTQRQTDWCNLDPRLPWCNEMAKENGQCWEEPQCEATQAVVDYVKQHQEPITAMLYNKVPAERNGGALSCYADYLAKTRDDVELKRCGEEGIQCNDRELNKFCNTSEFSDADICKNRAGPDKEEPCRPLSDSAFAACENDPAACQTMLQQIMNLCDDDIEKLKTLMNEPRSMGPRRGCYYRPKGETEREYSSRPCPWENELKGLENGYEILGWFS